MSKLYLIGGIVAALLALWLIKGSVEAGAKRQEAIAHKIEIRRDNPIIRMRWRDRRQAALNQGLTFAEAEPDSMETIQLEIKAGETVSVGPGFSVHME